MRIATWNVNSLKMRLSHVLQWLELAHIDALVMQEIKMTDDLFPHQSFEDNGFHAIWLGQKTYNGVALIARKTVFTQVDQTVFNLPRYPDPQKRFIAATLHTVSDQTLRLAGGYFPNGQEVGSQKYFYKLEWIAALTDWIQSELKDNAPLLLGGDFNIAPSDQDVWNPESYKDSILVSVPERLAYQTLLDCGLTDTWTLGLHAAQSFSWWDYRQSGFELNHGLRIDHFLAAPSLTSKISDVFIDSTPRGWEKPSDHAPVVVDMELT